MILGSKYHSDKQFTTFDADNDNWKEKNCAKSWKGAWWYKGCYYSNLNGEYGKNVHWNNRVSLFNMVFTEMKFRPM